MSEIQRWYFKCLGNLKFVRDDEVGGFVRYDDHARIVAEKDAEIERLREALVEITKKQGPYSRNQLEHADNCIERMAEVASKALNGEVWQDD